MTQVVPPQPKANSRMLWIHLLAGPILWSVHFIVGYLFVEAFCQAGWNFMIYGINGISFVVIAWTVLALIVAGVFALQSYRGWRNIHDDRSLRDQFRESSAWFEGPGDFLYFSGFLLSVLFALIILMVGLPALFLYPC